MDEKALELETIALRELENCRRNPNSTSEAQSLEAVAWAILTLARVIAAK